MKVPLVVQEIRCIECAMRGHSLFSVLSDSQLHDLNDHKVCSVFRKGQYLFTENARPMGLYCVHAGKIKMTTIGLDGREQIIRLAKDGDVLGYRALLTNERYRLSAIALEDCSVCVIEKEFFIELATKEPNMSQRVFKLLSADLKNAEDHIVSLSQKNVRERMAEALLFLKATYGLEEDGLTINVRLSREELADYIGTATESVIRLLSEFNTGGIIELEGKKIRIRDQDRLVKTANIPI